MARKKSERAEHSLMTQVILLHPKADTTEEALTIVFKAAHAMQQHVPCPLTVSAGENHSTRHRGFAHGIVLHFEDEDHLQEVMAHQKYLALQQRIHELCDQIIVLELPETLQLPVIIREVPAQSSEPSTRKQQKGRQKKASSAPVYQSEPQSDDRQQRQLRQCMSEREFRIRSLDPQLVRIIADQLGADESEVLPNASFVEDLNADSLDLVELIMSFEETFKITIPDEDAEMLTTGAEVQAYLACKKVLSAR